MPESRVRVPAKVKEVAKEDFNQARQLASEAVRSAAYLYPFKVRAQILATYITSLSALKGESWSDRTRY
jgi:hypothetical protein